MSEHFKPGVDAARRALGNRVPIVNNVHPGGAKGVQLSLNEVADRIKKGRNDPRVRAWAIRSIKDAGGPQGSREQAQAILTALKQATVYVQDPVNTEFIQAAHETLCLDDKGLCFRGGDCFLASEPVVRRTGTSAELVAIETLAVGDYIWGWNNWTRVEAVIAKKVLSFSGIQLAGRNEPLFLTKDHHVLLMAGNKQKRVRVKELRTGVELLTPTLVEMMPPEFRPTNFDYPHVGELQHDVRKAEAFDIQTEDHYVYLPKHDVTVSNCDDLVVAFGSATLSVGIPTKIIGECFNFEASPSHVLAAIQDSKTGMWLHVDPSTNKPVGDYVRGTREQWIDPMNPPGKGLSGNDTSGDFVGVGSLASAQDPGGPPMVTPAPFDPTPWIIGAIAVGGVGLLIYMHHATPNRAPLSVRSARGRRHQTDKGTRGVGR
jgi:hypothetical protein